MKQYTCYRGYRHMPHVWGSQVCPGVGYGGIEDKATMTVDPCVHPWNKVYESEEVEGREICYACNEVLIDPPPDPEEIAALEAEEQVRRQSRPDDIT